MANTSPKTMRKSIAVRPSTEQSNITKPVRNYDKFKKMIKKGK